MGQIQEGSFKVTIPPGATLKGDEEKPWIASAGQAGGPVPGAGGGGTIFIHRDIENDSKEGDIVLEYSYSWPGGHDGGTDSPDSP